ncbi:MAG: TolC family protein [Bacteroidetes bacterium]|nr:TolC family protein [Bacteroidota bacterium]
MSGNILRSAFAAFTVFMAVNASAQEAMPLSMQQAMDYAVKNNAAAKNARLDVKIQQAQVNQQISAAYPHFAGKAEFDYNIKPMQMLVDQHNFNPSAPAGTLEKFSLSLPFSSSLGVSGSQIIFDGSVLVALQARNTVIELARQNGQLTEENVRYNVQRAYYGLVIAHRQFDVIKSSLSNARDIAHDIAVLRQSGFAEKIDEDRTNVQVNNLATDSLKIANLLTVSEQLLKFQMGMDIHQPIVLTDTSVENNVTDAISVLAQSADYNQRTEFSLLNTQQKLNEYNLRRYRYSAIPTLNAFGNAGFNYANNKFSNMFTPNSYFFNSLIGLQLNVPLFSGFLEKNLIRETKYNIEKTQNNIDNVKLTIDFQSEQARATLTNDMLQLQSQRRNMDLANSVLDLARKKYKAGVGSNLEVNQAQTDLLMAQNNYFSSLLDVVNAHADLKKALGLLK